MFVDACRTYPQIYTPSLTPIQVFKENSWLYICEEGFTRENAQVVCRENAQTELIGFSSLNISEQRHIYPIENFRYYCNGNETSLCDCSKTPQTCQSNKIAAVMCNLPSMLDILESELVHILIIIGHREYQRFNIFGHRFATFFNIFIEKPFLL